MHTLNFKQENIPHLSFTFFIRYHVHIFPVGKKKLFYVMCYSVICSILSISIYIEKIKNTCGHGIH